MAITANAAANIAAYGQHYAEHDELRLLYAPHGRFHRTRLAIPAEPDLAIVHALRQQIRDGDPAWVTRKTPLAAAMRMASDD